MLNKNVMERKVLDLITTKYVVERAKAEIEIEKAVTTKAFENNMDIDNFTNSIMTKISKLREINSDAQLWENIVTQIVTQVPEKE
jgi:hypothetical protein